MPHWGNNRKYCGGGANSNIGVHVIIKWKTTRREYRGFRFYIDRSYGI
jgi:hypothetical protein